MTCGRAIESELGGSTNWRSDSMSTAESALEELQNKTFYSYFVG